MEKKKKLHKWRKVLGVIFLILGFFGLFLPILQGILFILIGLALLGFGPAKKWLARFRKNKKNGVVPSSKNKTKTKK
ncbi:MAG: hypothetical protein KKD18_05010 [Nanoarchaeota archaeon]|nr:hypothetical protein [Nanoarchaeota archaeon]